MFLKTNPNVLRNQEKINTIESRFKKALEDNDMADLKQIIIDLEIVCPVSGTRNWTEVRQFNLMFSTQVGSVADESDTIYLRPETAQGIFVNFLNVLNTSRQRIPFGIAQVGKAFRNEIVAGSLSSAPGSLSRWRCSFSCGPVRRWSGTTNWKEAAYGLAPVAGHGCGRPALSRSYQAGALCQCSRGHRVQFSFWFQGDRGHTLAHGF